MIIFAIGRRCNTVEFLKKFKIYKGASPFDWHMVTLETAIYFINNNFENFIDDIYLPWDKKIINKKNHKTLTKYVDNFEYLRINLRNHKHFGLNLNTVDINNLETNLYEAQKGLYYFHYDMDSDKIKQQQKRRIDRFLNEDPNNCLLLYIWSSLRLEEIQKTILYIKEKVSSVVKKHYNFLFVLPIENLQNSMETIHVDKKLSIIALKVPKWDIQSKKYYNENNLNNPQIKWKQLYRFIFKNYSIS